MHLLWQDDLRCRLGTPIEPLALRGKSNFRHAGDRKLLITNYQLRSRTRDEAGYHSTDRRGRIIIPRAAGPQRGNLKAIRSVRHPKPVERKVVLPSRKIGKRLRSNNFPLFVSKLNVYLV